MALCPLANGGFGQWEAPAGEVAGRRGVALGIFHSAPVCLPLLTIAAPVRQSSPYSLEALSLCRCLSRPRNRKVCLLLLGPDTALPSAALPLQIVL